MTLTPIQTAAVIVLLLTIIGAIISFVSIRQKFAGYEYISVAARALARSLKGETTRDGPDLMIVGEYQGLPTIVRFSNNQKTQGLTILLRAKASFAMSVLPAAVIVEDGSRNEIRTGDAAFDNRFTIRTDQPTQVALLLTRQTFANVQKLACSAQTHLHMRPGEIELTETTIPSTQTWDHVILHVQSMRVLAEAVQAIPGAEDIKIVRPDRDRYIPGRIAIAVGVLAAIIVVIGSAHSPTESAKPTNPAYVPAGMSPNDALNMPDLKGWRIATSDDFQPDAMGWLRSFGLDGHGVLPGDFSGTGYGADIAYVLVNPAKRYRLVILANHTIRYDSEFNVLAAVGRIPRAAVTSIQWSGQPPQSVTGDGVLIVTNAQDRSSGVAVFLGDGRIASGVPSDYQAVSLR